MMLDVHDAAGKPPAGKGTELIGDARDLLPVLQLRGEQPRARPIGQYIAELAEKIGAPAAIDRNVRDVGEIDVRLLQTIRNSLRGKPGPMLDPAKPFLLGRRQKFAAAQNAGRGVGVIGVDAEIDQVKLTS